MSTNADVIAKLEAAKNVLQSAANAASGDEFSDLTGAINAIDDELDELEQDAVEASYVPATNPFQSATKDGQAFLATLAKIKTGFASLAAVAGAADAITKVILKL